MTGWWATIWQRLRSRVTVPLVQGWVVDANDGIIATAGLLEGFAGAGADDALLITAALAATIAGALSTGGAKWAEMAAERDAHLVTVAYEQQQLAAHPEEEIAELVGYYEGRGLTPELAREVAEQLHANDPLAAQLETEYGIDEVRPARGPVFDGINSGAAFTVGAAIPLLIVIAPIALDELAVLLAVVVSLIITSVIAAQSSHVSTGRMIARTLIVGIGTMAVSYAAGLALLPPAD